MLVLKLTAFTSFVVLDSVFTVPIVAFTAVDVALPVLFTVLLTLFAVVTAVK